MSSRFIRQDTVRHSRLGKNRPKLLKWRRPRGRHNKVRRKRFGYPLRVEIGYASPRSQTGRIEGKLPCLVHNLQELKAVPKTHCVIIARVGARKKLELLKEADKCGLVVVNTGRSA